MKNFIKLSLVIVLVILLPIFGCTRGENVEERQRAGLEINSMNASIGSANTNDNTHDIQRFSYSIGLTNNEKDAVFIKEVTLILPREFEEKIVSKLLIASVNKYIDSNSTIEIKGSLDFKANDMSKEDIIKLDPRILSVKVTNERTINLEK